MWIIFCIVCKKDKLRLADLRLLETSGGHKIKIIDSLAAKWKYFGTLFNFDDSGRELDNIEAHHKSEGPTACCQEMFQQWLNGKGMQPATWEVLIKLLKDSDEETLAVDIERALDYGIL